MRKGNIRTRVRRLRGCFSCFQRARWFLKTTALTVTIAFLGLYFQPVALAAHQAAHAPTPQARTESNEEKLARTLEAVEDRLEKLDAKLTRRQAAEKEKADLKTLRQDLDAQDQKAIEDFDAIEQHLQDKNLPQVILDRHYEAVRTYKREMTTLKANLNAVEKETDDTRREVKVRKAKEHLKAKHKKRGPRTTFDPNDLPHKSLQPNLNNKPKRKRDDFVRAGLFDNPTVKLAAHGAYRIDQLAAASDPAFLAETVEVTLTQAIKDKAAELGHNPVKIYDWVRNNVEWLPSWGAMQDADVTLGSKRGNSIDIASLLIALLRASDIPARYVHGTIEMSPDKFMNWAGGFTDLMAAALFASSGGVPITTLVSGGIVSKIQLEHMWVEAAIDLHPSRGAINKSADNWVQLDASYKQYEYLPGLDVVAISGIDPAVLAQSFVASGTVNEQEGWVTGLNPAILQAAQTQAQATLEQHIQTNLPNPTVGDVIGGRRIIPVTGSVLPTNLPNRALLIGARYATVPGPLQHTMTFAFGLDPLREPINPVTFPWSRLNNHKVTLSFKPATAADEQTLASLLPPGPITDPSQLPGSIPSYLVIVIPEIAVDGQVVGQGNAMRLGEEFSLIYDIVRISGGGSQTYTYSVIAGSYLSVAVAGGSVSPAKLDALRTKLEATQSVLQSGDAAAIGALTGEDIVGDMFHAGTLGYFGQYLSLSHVANQSQQARHALPYAYGTLGYEPDVHTLFGFPRAIQAGGVAVNVRLAWVIHALDGDRAKRRDLTLQTGMLSSALEHAVPEQMFSDPQNPVAGVSAVKALSIAGAQDQRIYHITPQNQAQVLPNLHLDGLAMNEIAQALATGKEVIAHTDRITVPGWTGEGYILFDPVTGDGAYKITGGSNGGWLFVGLSSIGFMMWISIVPALAATGPFAVIIIVLALFAFLLLFLQALEFAEASMEVAHSDCPDDVKKTLAGALTFIHVTEALVGRFFRAFTADLSGVRKALAEVLGLLAVDATFSLLQVLAIESTSNQLSQCKR